MDFFPVIPAGGSGKRLWPLSRVQDPKFFLRLANAQASLFAETLERLAALAPGDHAYVVTGPDYADRLVAAAPGLRAANVLAEPSPMDSGPAIALAAAVIRERHPGSVMGTFAADHHIPDVEPFADALRTAIAGAEDGLLMTVGIEPTRPDTGYGYIHFDAGAEDHGVLPVRRFKEKPSLSVAREFLAGGEYLWNASMFVWRPEVFLDELRRQDPRMHDGVTAIAAAWDTPDRTARLAEIWPTLDRIAVEYLVMEPAAARGRVATVRGRFGWTDVGDFNTLGELAEPDAHGNTVIAPGPARPAGAAAGVDVLESDNGGVTVLRGCSNVVVHPSAGRLVAAIGVEDVAIVDTGDVVLICARDRVQEVKAVVDALAETSRRDVL